MSTLTQPWDTPFGLPPFGQFTEADFPPAFQAAMADHRAEIAAIAGNPAAPDFANTIAALEQAGRALTQICAVFFNLCSSHTNPDLQAIERDMAPVLSRHNSAILLDQALAARVFAIDPAALTGEQARVTTLYHRRFTRAGARLDDAGRARMSALMARLAELGTQFGQNVLADERDWALALGQGDLDGLPDFLVAAAAEEARRRDQGEGHVITLSRSSIEPFLVFSTRRDLRETAWRAWVARGETTNWPLVAETVALRLERARLLGQPNFAALKLDDQMAKTPERVRDLLMQVWTPARAKAEAEAAALQALAEAPLAPWDWRHYAEIERKRLHDLDEAETKPYLQLDAMIAAAFDVAQRLFGVTAHAVDVPLHHPDARAWEIKRADGSHLGLSSAIISPGRPSGRVPG